MTTPSTERQLPAKWDDVPVEWDTEWKTLYSLGFSCITHGVGDSESLCHVCGTTALHPFKEGRMKGTWSHPDLPKGKRWKTSTERRLWATRCPHCGHDEVVDRLGEYYGGEAYDLWCLGAEDYGEEGSHLIIESTNKKETRL